MTPETWKKFYGALSYTEDISGIGSEGDIDGEAWHIFMTEIIHYIPDRTFKNALRELLRDYPQWELFRDVGEAIGMRFKTEDIS